jgi:hypothetical protein
MQIFYFFQGFHIKHTTLHSYCSLFITYLFLKIEIHKWDASISEKEWINKTTKD